MKKHLVILGAFLVPFLLNGCDDDSDYLNQTETVLLQQCQHQTENTRISCTSAYQNTIAAARTVMANHGNGVENPESEPFSGQGITFIIEDKSFKERHPEMKSLNEFWHEYTGKWIYGAPEQALAGDTKKVGQTYVLSPAMYDELIQAVKTCNRATVEAMDFKAGTQLSPEQYDKAMNIIIECKQSQLDQAINQK